MTPSIQNLAAILVVSSIPFGVFAQTAQPTETDTTRIVEASSAYFLARDRGDYAAAYAMLDANLSALMSFAEAQLVWADQTAQGITFESVDLVNVTWYVDPDGLPPGAYAALDFRNSTPEAPVICGFLVWRNLPGAPELTRIEVNVMNAATFAQVDAANLPSLLSQLGCR